MHIVLRQQIKIHHPIVIGVVFGRQVSMIKSVHYQSWDIAFVAYLMCKARMPFKTKLIRSASHKRFLPARFASISNPNGSLAANSKCPWCWNAPLQADGAKDAITVGCRY